mgnify:CR=1 FL=1
MVLQLSTLSLPSASIRSITASNLKSISHCCDGSVGNDLGSVFEQDGAALAALVGFLGEALAAVKGAADRVAWSLGVAHDTIDDGIATHEAQACGRNSRLTVLDRWLLLVVVGGHWLVDDVLERSERTRRRPLEHDTIGPRAMMMMNRD